MSTAQNKFQMKNIIQVILNSLLIASTTCFSANNNDQSHPQNQALANHQASSVHQTEKTILQKIKQVKNKGHLKEAEKIALNHLNNYPNDTDVMLLLGFTYYNQKNYAAAEKYFNKVIKINPQYTDAYIGLIRIKLAKNDIPSAKRLLKTAFKTAPHHQTLMALNSKIKKLSTHRKNVKIKHKKQNPAVKKTYPASAVLLSVFRAHTKEMQGLIQEGKKQFSLNHYALAANQFKQIEGTPFQNNIRDDYLARINAISPRFSYGVNSLDFYTYNAYVSDLHAIWDYTSLAYNRETHLGTFRFQVKQGHRYGDSALQYGVFWFGRANQSVYFDLFADYADAPQVFSNYNIGGEIHGKINEDIELSIGKKYTQLESTNFITNNASFALYKNSWLFLFKPNLYESKSNRHATLYTLSLQKTFDTIDHTVKMTVGKGRSPDLADLTSTDVIIINNQFINLGYRFPIYQHKIILDVSAGYNRWAYPTGLVRHLYDLNAGLKYTF